MGVSVVPRAASIAYIRLLPLLVVSLQEPWAARQLFLCARSGVALHSAAQLLFDHLRTQT